MVFKLQTTPAIRLKITNDDTWDKFEAK